LRMKGLVKAHVAAISRTSTTSSSRHLQSI
jgi:hypothetical protein